MWPSGHLGGQKTAKVRQVRGPFFPFLIFSLYDRASIIHFCSGGLSDPTLEWADALPAHRVRLRRHPRRLVGLGGRHLPADRARTGAEADRRPRGGAVDADEGVPESARRLVLEAAEGGAGV